MSILVDRSGSFPGEPLENLRQGALIGYTAAGFAERPEKGDELAEISKF